MSENNKYQDQIFDYHRAATVTDSLFQEAGYGTAGNYLTNLAGQESIYGSLPSHLSDEGVPISMSAYQIDPIKYQDFLERSQGGAALERVNLVNQELQNRGYGENFDIRNIAEVTGDKESGFNYGSVNMDLARDPLVSTMLARTMLASDPSKLPTELYNAVTIEQPDGTFAPGERSKDASEALLNQFGSWKDVPDEMLGQSGYWKKNWNTDAGKGDPRQFEQKFESYRQSMNVEDDIIDIMKDQDFDLSIQSSE